MLILRYQIFNNIRKLLPPFRILSLKAYNNHRENYKPKKSKKLNLSQRAFSRFQLAFHLIKSFLSPSVALIRNKRPIARKLFRSEFTKISELSTDIGAQFMVGQLKTFTKWAIHWELPLHWWEMMLECALEVLLQNSGVNPVQPLIFLTLMLYSLI